MNPPTPRQRDAIRAVDEHVLVTAGAGTGKTSTVVGRILYLLGAEIEGECLPQERRVGLRDIAAITYTNAAAADLKSQLRDRLRAAGLARAAYEVDGARIGTIHGFCGGVLREFALRTGRNPAMRVLEEGEGAALVAETVHEVVLDALDAGQVPGLEELFAVWSVGEVERWLCRLAGDGTRLDRIAEHAGELGPLERTVIKLAALARSAVEQRLLRSSSVDFDRMIAWTRELLDGYPPARRALQRRIHTLIVDEFQDVDPVQRDIAWLLGEPESLRADTTRLMLVGDPKQSIYRFRRADVTVWTGVQRKFEGEGFGRVIPLDVNFRSVAAVLGMVDATVGPILDRPLEGGALQAFEVGYLPVEPSRGVPGPAVELLAVHTPDGVKAEARRRAEARAVAERACELHAEGVPWREMAVLLVAKSDLAIYETALRGAGVPTYALGAEGFYEGREVLDLLLALETLRDPQDDRALLGFFRSPFVGLKDESLLDIARQAAQPYWNSLDGVSVGEQELLEWGRALVREHAALRDRIPTHELLERLLDRSGYRAHLAALGAGGEQPLANVRKLVGMARALRDLSAGDFLRIVRDVRERGDREGDARLFGEREDVVTITTIHSAKGLEWAVVFWCDLARPPRNDAPPIVIGREAIALKDPDAESDEQPERYRALLARDGVEGEAERKRLWYVAMTRAKDRLVLAGFGTDGMRDGCPGAAILDELDVELVDGGRVAYRDRDGREFEAPVRVVTADEDATAQAPARGEFVAAEVPALVPPLSAAPGRPRHSATELMLFTRCERRHWFRYVAGLREPEVNRTGAQFTNAVARGQIVHDVLEHIKADEEFDQLLDAAIGRWDETAPPPDTVPGRRYREELAKIIKAVSSRPDYRALADAPQHRNELPFLLIAGPDAFVEGKIDLAAAAGDGLAALDVKTGGGDAEAAHRKAEHYALQRDVYVSALDALSGRAVERFSFLFAESGVSEHGTVTGADRRAARAELDRVLSAVGSAPPALTRFPSECRFCGYRNERWCPGAAEPDGVMPAS